MKATQRISSFVVIAGALLACVDPASADSPHHAAFSERIQVEDLDLASPAIAANVYARIASTAGRLCRDASAPWDGSRASTVRRCTSAAICWSAVRSWFCAWISAG